jgi:hypothetical protein
VNGERIALGLFDTAKMASDAYMAAKVVYASQQYAGTRKRRRREGADGAPAGSATVTASSDGAAPVVASGGSTAPHDDATRGAGGDAAPARRKRKKGAAPPAEESDDDEGSGAFEAAAALPVEVPNPVRRSTRFRGVVQEGVGATLWEAQITLPDGRVLSGGEYEGEEEAAKAYDALARMYLGGDAPTNFASDPYTAWLPPEAVATVGQIETRIGVPLTVEEVVTALQQERGVNVVSMSLEGKSDLAGHMVWVTGTSVPHMRKMADMLSRAVRARGRGRGRRTRWCAHTRAPKRSCASAACRASTLAWRPGTWTTGWWWTRATSSSTSWMRVRRGTVGAQPSSNPCPPPPPRPRVSVRRGAGGV